MTQPMENFNIVMQGYMLGATIRMACTMMLELVCTVIPRERERLIQALGHEPTQENWEDYWQFLGEQVANPKCLQSAEDREKIRRLVFGDKINSPASS
jgi:hypothetical protein